MKDQSANPDANAAETIFNAALAFSAGERPAYLAGACGDNLLLRQRVEALLRAHDAPQGFLPDQPIATPRTTIFITPISETAGTVIGRYKLLQQIGEGGCGVVYMAEQQEPVRRRVALKVIKLGMDKKQVIARFEAERQALALMDHANIAKVLDAGATETGRPYFVMELVKGIPITRYCDENNLSTATRLGLFVQVCQAIQHAHQKGIIHRDIKPSNILVADHDGVPVPKIIDFGIAKATTDQRLTDKTLFTAFEQFIGTPAYMSPEQANLSGLDIDTRSDIYSLGVLLYELLMGKTPFEGKRLLDAGLDEIRRIIREDEPVRPSTRLHTLDAAEQTTVAKHRQSDPPKLAHLISGDLDWIVMKALEKDRTRRYETARRWFGATSWFSPRPVPWQ
jgi:serine/threonine protein kinase